MRRLTANEIREAHRWIPVGFSGVRGRCACGYPGQTCPKQVWLDHVVKELLAPEPAQKEGA